MKPKYENFVIKLWGTGVINTPMYPFALGNINTFYLKSSFSAIARFFFILYCRTSLLIDVVILAAMAMNSKNVIRLSYTENNKSNYYKKKLVKRCMSKFIFVC